MIKSDAFLILSMTHKEWLDLNIRDSLIKDWNLTSRRSKGDARYVGAHEIRIMSNTIISTLNRKIEDR